MTLPGYAEIIETRKCRRSLHYFLWEYVWIYDASSGEWIRFHLWPAQWHVADALLRQRQIVILKARQLGLTWLVLGYALWRMLFHPAVTVLLFSRRLEEAQYLLGTERLRGMYQRLPDWMRLPEALRNSADCWVLANGSVARAFPSNAGDSYTASLAILDEADLVPDLEQLLRRVKPTVDGGGQIIVLSRVNKDTPHSAFQRLYREAKSQPSSWYPIFLPWYARPDRTAAWYQAIRQDILQRTGSLDELYEQYPSTDTEALAPRQLAKRFPLTWLQSCYEDIPPLESALLTSHRHRPAGTPSSEASVPANWQKQDATSEEVLGQLLALCGPQLCIYRLPQAGHYYVLGADPAEGNPQSDCSAAVVFDADLGEEVAVFHGRAEPAVFAHYLAELAGAYHGAAILVERNQHGHAVLLALSEHLARFPERRPRPALLPGSDGRLGWLTTSGSKATLFTHLAEQLRQGRCRMHHRATFEQLADLDGATLRAPPGQADDLAMAFALAVYAAQHFPNSPQPIRVGGTLITVGYTSPAMEPTGLEPATSGLQSRRSPS